MLGSPGWGGVRKLQCLAPSFPWKAMIYMKCHPWKLLEITIIIWRSCGERTRRWKFIFDLCQCCVFFIPDDYCGPCPTPVPPTHLRDSPLPLGCPLGEAGSSSGRQRDDYSGGSDSLKACCCSHSLCWAVLKDTANTQATLQFAPFIPTQQLCLDYPICPLSDRSQRPMVGDTAPPLITALHSVETVVEKPKPSAAFSK